MPAAEPQPPGFYPGIPFDDYCAWANVSVHQLQSIAKSPAHFLAAMERPRMQTAPMMLGAAFHKALLEPAQFDRWYANALDLDKRSKAGRAAFDAAQAEGITLLKADDWDAIQAMRYAIRAHPYASILLAPEDGEAEVSIAWRDAETGVFCRARPDFVNYAHNAVVDLKSAADASMGAFARACANYNYFWQASMYLDGLKTVKELGAQGSFIFVAIESEPPWAIGIYELAPDDLALGRTLYRKALRVYQECLETGVWPGYPEGIRQLELPSWARIIPAR